MFNFEQLVKSLLVEAPFVFPVWFQEILAKHKQLGLGTITEADVRKIMPLVFKGYLSAQDIKSVSKGILILDTLKTIYQLARQKPANTFEEFFNSSNLKVKQEIDLLGANAAKVINSYTKKEEWTVSNTDVSREVEKQKVTLKQRIKGVGQIAAGLAGLGGVGDIYGGVR